MVKNKKFILYKFFLSTPFMLFILINAFTINYINVPGVDDSFITEYNKNILERNRVGIGGWGLILPPLLFFWLFGISPLTLRISQLFFLFLTLFLFSKLELSPKKKIMGLFLLTTSPFIIPGRNEVNFLPFFVLLPFILLDRKKINYKKIFLSSLILGFGSGIKLTILLFAMPLLFYFILFKKFESKKILCAVLGLILGVSPLLISETVSEFFIFKYGIQVILNGKTSEEYGIFNLFSNSLIVLSKFKNSLSLIPYDFLPTNEFFNLPLVNLSFLFLIPIYFFLFFLSSFILIKKRLKLELVLACLSFIFLLQFNLSVPKSIHFYFIFPFIIFLILKWVDEKYLPLLIIPLFFNCLLTYEITINLSNEKFFPWLSSYNHELFSFLATSKFNNINSTIITPFKELYNPFLRINSWKILIQHSPNGDILDKEMLNDIDSLMQNETLIFIFPSYERKTVEEKSIYDKNLSWEFGHPADIPFCGAFEFTNHSLKYSCYDITEFIKDKVKDKKMELIKTINASDGLPVYEIYVISPKYFLQH
jgi:hypothetical protein